MIVFLWMVWVFFGVILGLGLVIVKIIGFGVIFLIIVWVIVFLVDILRKILVFFIVFLSDCVFVIVVCVDFYWFIFLMWF